MEHNISGKRSKFDGLKGQKYGQLTVISDPIIKNSFRYYICKCECGVEKEIRADGFVNGYVQSCGCYNKEIISGIKLNSRKHNNYTVIDDVVYVELTNSDEIMICDMEDWENLKGYCWLIGSDGYARTNFHIDDMLMSKKFHINIIGKKNGFVIDHINRNKLDNRRCNLRHVTKQANSVNCNVSKNNTTGVPGVYRRKDYDRWKATIFVNGKEISLGHYVTKEEAIKARRKGEEKYFSPLFEGKEVNANG